LGWARGGGGGRSEEDVGQTRSESSGFREGDEVSMTGDAVDDESTHTQRKKRERSVR